MSRVGKKPITIPTGVTAKVDGDLIIVKGPLGELQQKLHPQVKIIINEGVINVAITNEAEKAQRALWGLFASLIRNMIIGVTTGFTKQLEINGVGFKFAVAGKRVVLNIGYSHPVEYQIPEGVNVKVDTNIMTITGCDKQLVGETTAQIRKLKKVEPYKGKGIRYVGEYVKQKAGKTATSTTK